MYVIRFTTRAFQHQGRNTWLLIPTSLCETMAAIDAEFLVALRCLCISWSLLYFWKTAMIWKDNECFEESGFLVTRETCLSSSNTLWPQNLFLRIHIPHQIFPWSRCEVVAGEVLVGCEQCRNEGTFGQPLSHLKIVYCGMFPFSIWAKTLGVFFPSAFFFFCVQMPWGPDNVILLRHSEALRCCKTWHMRIASHRPTPPPINKHASCSSPKINVYQKWHFSTSLILSKVSVWQRRGKGRQVHLLNCSVRMWRSWAGSPITIEGLQDMRVWECKCFGKAGNRGARRLWSVWLCHGYLSAHDKERKNNMVRKTEQLYL